jgi:predicted nucleotidyltransferase
MADWETGGKGCLAGSAPTPPKYLTKKFASLVPDWPAIVPDATPSKFCYNESMERDQAIARLKEHEAELKRLGVQHLYLFGSTARGDAREDSDVDLFFDYEQGKLGLFELMDVKEAAARILGRKTDIMTRDSIHRVLRERIEASAVPVF